MVIEVQPKSEKAHKVFKDVMGNNPKASLDMVKDDFVFFSTHTGNYQTWSALDGDDWQVILPS